ncbi:SRPBCC family protein [Haloferacaceae archaeon DSL9]
MTTKLTDAVPDEAADGGRASAPSSSGRTLGRTGRIVSAGVGGALLLSGLGRRSLRRAATTILGGWLLYRGITGESPRVRSLGGADRERGELEASEDERREVGASAGAIEAERTVTVRKPADELSPFWREPDRLARIMSHVADVSPLGGGRQHWEVRGPLGRVVAWDSQIVEDRTGEFLRWESLDGATVPNEGWVRFRSAPGDRGTETTLHLRFDPPGGPLGRAAIRTVGLGPDALVGTALRRFKSLAETGEIPTLENNPSGRGAGDLV